MEVTLDEQLLNLILGAVLPALVALITKADASSKVKAATLGFLTVLSATGATILENGGTFNLKETIVSILVTYVTAQTGYSAVLKPMGVTGGIAKRTANKGIGKPKPRVIEADVVKAKVVEAEDVKGKTAPAPDPQPTAEPTNPPAPQDESDLDQGDEGEEAFAFLNSELDRHGDLSLALRNTLDMVDPGWLLKHQRKGTAGHGVSVKPAPAGE